MRCMSSSGTPGRTASSRRNFPVPAGRAVVLRRAAGSLAPHGTGGPQDPAVLYTPQAIAAELPGLIVKRAGRVHRPVDTEDGVRQAIDTLVLAACPG